MEIKEIDNIKDIKELCINTNKNPKIGILEILIRNFENISFDYIKKVWFFDYSKFVEEKTFLKIDNLGVTHNKNYKPISI